MGSRGSVPEEGPIDFQLITPPNGVQGYIHYTKCARVDSSNIRDSKCGFRQDGGDDEENDKHYQFVETRIPIPGPLTFSHVWNKFYPSDKDTTAVRFSRNSGIRPGGITHHPFRQIAQGLSLPVLQQLAKRSAAECTEPDLDGASDEDECFARVLENIITTNLSFYPSAYADYKRFVAESDGDAEDDVWREKFWKQWNGLHAPQTTALLSSLGVTDEIRKGMIDEGVKGADTLPHRVTGSCLVDRVVKNTMEGMTAEQRAHVVQRTLKPMRDALAANAITAIDREALGRLVTDEDSGSRSCSTTAETVRRWLVAAGGPAEDVFWDDVMADVGNRIFEDVVTEESSGGRGRLNMRRAWILSGGEGEIPQYLTDAIRTGEDEAGVATYKAVLHSWEALPVVKDPSTLGLQGVQEFVEEGNQGPGTGLAKRTKRSSWLAGCLRGRRRN